MKKCAIKNCCCQCQSQYKLYDLKNLSDSIGYICLLQGEIAIIIEKHGCCECWGKRINK